MYVINGAYLGQRVTGQQRYASQISRELLGHNGVRQVSTTQESAVRSWLWTQTALPARARGEWLLSLTARAPATQRRHVATVHDLFPITHPEWYSRRYRSVHAPLLRHQLRTAAAIVTVSPVVAEEIEGSGLLRAGGRVVVAPNAPSSLPPTAEPTDTSPFFLTVGSLEPRKNLATVIAAYSRLPRDTRLSTPLLVVGGAHAAFAGAEIPTDVEGVRFLGYVDDAVLASLYRPGAILVSMSRAEGFGLPVIESAVGGTGLVLSDIPVYRWLAGDDAVYADPGDPESVTGALAQALDRPAPDERQTATIDRFSWSRSAITIHELMSALATN